MNEELNSDLMPIDPVRISVYTQHLTPAATGVYFRLLCYQWMHGNVPENWRVRERIAKGCRKAWPELISLFEPYDGQLRAAWLEESRAKVMARREELQRRTRPAASRGAPTPNQWPEGWCPEPAKSQAAKATAEGGPKA